MPLPTYRADRPANRSAGAAAHSTSDGHTVWPAWLQQWLRNASRDLLGLAMLAAAVVCGLALVTFRATDLDTLVVSSTAGTHNLLGGFGAGLGGQLLYWLGLAAWAVPGALLMAGTVCLLLPSAASLGIATRKPLWRMAAMAGLVLAFAAVLGDANPPLPGAPVAGGALGMSLLHLGGVFGGVEVARWVFGLLLAGALWVSVAHLPARIAAMPLASPMRASIVTDSVRAPSLDALESADALEPESEDADESAEIDSSGDDLVHVSTEKPNARPERFFAEAPAEEPKKKRRSNVGIFHAMTRLLRRDPEPAVDDSSVPAHVLLTADDLAAPAPSGRRVAASSQRANQPQAAPRPAAQADPRYMIPPPELLSAAPVIDASMLDTHAHDTARRLQEALFQFKVEARVIGIDRGPTVTLYELELPPGTKIRKLSSLEHDLGMALRVESVRVVAPIPGRGGIGVEIPNQASEPVMLRELLHNGEAQRMAREQVLPFVIGRDSVGRPVMADLADMPHLLIAGTTGSGKSCAANALVLSLIFTRHHEDVRFVIIDPKMVEFAAYRDIPHLMLPIVTDNREAAGVLEYLVEEMERRYRYLERTLCKHIKEFNDLSPAERLGRVTGKIDEDEAARDPLPDRLPYIVAMVDELADLMMVAGKDVEGYICRLAQKSRAVGIHLVLATQRPSVDVITGLIKANIPSRISFRVLSGIDSKTILDRPGAERLLGRGDALFLPAGRLDLVRCQGAFVTNDDILRVTRFVKAQARANYIQLPVRAASEDYDDDDDARPRKRRKKKNARRLPGRSDRRSRREDVIHDDFIDAA